MWYVYFLENGAGKRYVGATGKRPQTRCDEHNDGINGWTRAHRPWNLVYSESHATKREALLRERYFKTGAGRKLRDELIDLARLGRS